MQKKRKIVNIITKLELGGAQQVALYSADSLGDGFESYFISGEEGTLDKGKLEEYKNITAFYNISEMKREIRPFQDFKAFINLYLLLKRIKPKIVHTHCPKAGVLGRWAAFFARVPVIIHTHHGFAFDKGLNKKFYVILEKLNSLITNKLIFVSEENLQTALKNKIAKKEKMKIIHCGIDIAAYKETARHCTQVDVVVGVIACFKSVKAPLDIIRIAKELPSVKFKIIGDGNLRLDIENEIKKLEVENVELLGWRDDVKDLLKTFNVFILTSISEGLPMAVMEAMASGVPVIATNVGGLKNLIIADYNGVLLKPHDIKGFAENIEILLNNENLRQKFIENSYKILTNEFDKNTTIQEIRNLYLGMIK